jgi:hypothetical protein
MSEADVDGDGLSDSYELSVGLDPNNASGDDGAGGDPDGDGFVNHAEQVAGTDPLDAGSNIGIVGFDLHSDGGQTAESGRSVTMRWSAVVGRDYRIEFAPVLQGPWVDISGIITADQEVMTRTIDLAESKSQFIRIIVVE